jgi:hypothetical protein
MTAAGQPGDAVAPGGNGTPPRRALWFAWLATFFAFAAVAHGNFETTDAGFTMHAAKNLWERGDSGLLRDDQGATSIAENQAARAIAAGISGKVGTNGVAYTWFPVGHVWLFVPFVAASAAIDRSLPRIEAAWRERVAPGWTDAQLASSLEYVRGGPATMQGLICLVVPPACAASILLLLVLLARTFGATARDAWIAALAIVFATQAFAFGRETLSDGPGLVFLLASALAVARVHAGVGDARTALFGGLAAGASVLLRYQNAALQVALGVALLLACRRTRQWRPLFVYGLAALPAAALLLGVDAARFGNAFDTGYPKVSDWLTEPMWLGALKMLFGAGRGVAWFSPLVWLALPLALRARDVPQWRWLCWIVFLFPLGFFALARGWQGGECWAARYVTHGLVLLLAIALPQARPWRRCPRTWWVLVAAGAFACATSVVAPVRGVQQLAGQAIEASTALRKHVDDDAIADRAAWHPRYTPLLANWRYAFASHVGGFEHASGRPISVAAGAIATVFGVEAHTDEQRLAPMRWEDRCWRHLWWRFWGDVLGVSGWFLLLPVLALAAVCACLAARAGVASDPSTAR